VTDAGTGLTDLGARWYDPATGIFASLDPVLETASPLQLNGYDYAGDSPSASA
jgi:RHS repeat-associated protein